MNLTRIRDDVITFLPSWITRILFYSDKIASNKIAIHFYHSLIPLLSIGFLLLFTVVWIGLGIEELFIKSEVCRNRIFELQGTLQD
jgi:hypothetical protein